MRAIEISRSARATSISGALGFFAGAVIILLTSATARADADDKFSGPLQHSHFSDDDDKKKDKCEGEGPCCEKAKTRAEKHSSDKTTAEGKSKSAVGQASNGTGSAYSGNGQQQGAASNASSQSGLADLMSAIAGGFEQESKDLAVEQRKIADDSYSSNPGASNPDAVQFHEANQGGQSIIANYKDATDPTVKDQAEAYDLYGETRKDAEKEAQNYRAREAEFRDLAAKNGRNADNLDSNSGNQASAITGNDAGSLPGSQQNARLLEKPGNAGLSEQGATKLTANPLGAKPAIKTTDPTQTDSNGGKGEKNEANPPLRSSSASIISRSADSIRDSIHKQLAGNGKDSIGKGIPGTAESDAKKGHAAAAAEGGDGSPGLAADNKNSAGNNGDEVLSPFGKPLGNPKFALPGSETEASVKNMLSEFSSGDTNGSREPASELSGGISGRDSPSLFERCHEIHARCARKNCVSVTVPRRGGS